MVYFKTTAKFWKSIEFFLTLGDMDQVNRPIGPGPLNITFRSDMPITFFISDFTTYILLISIRWSNVIGISDLNVMFKGPGSIAVVLLCH